VKHSTQLHKIRQAIADEVRATFANPNRKPSFVAAAVNQRVLPESAVSFDVHADVTTMMIGGISALLLQMLHPAALAGVWDFSNFREDMGGRLRRTAGFIAVTTYGSAADAEAAISRVRRIHSKVEGHLPDGRPYRANDPQLLTFVGVTEAISFLNAWVRYRDPLMLMRDQDRYFAEMAGIARRLGAEDVPETRRAAEAWLIAIRPQLRVDDRTREVARLLLSQVDSASPMAPAHRLMMDAGVDLLPGWARRMHRMPGAGFRAPLLRAGASGMGAVLRWAMAKPA